MTEIDANIAILKALAIALLLGLIVGYERTYQGRAAGMRTYGIVCMASAALTAFVAYPNLWYGGTVHGQTYGVADPTRVTQGIITGVGFLGSGIIIKDGLNTRGLTTAASVWSASAIGVLVGVGFTVAAFELALLSTLCMFFVHRLEEWLPSRLSISVVMQLKDGPKPTDLELRTAVSERGYLMVDGSLSINVVGGNAEWRFVATTTDRQRKTSLQGLAQSLNENPSISSFQLTHFRN